MTSNKTTVSISEAARMIGKGRQTIYRHLGSGKISTFTRGDGSKTIPIAELERVYGIRVENETISSADALRILELQAENSRLKADNQQMISQIDDLKNDKAWLQSLIDDLTVIRPSSPAQPLWGKLFGTDKERDQ